MGLGFVAVLGSGCSMLWSSDDFEFPADARPPQDASMPTPDATLDAGACRDNADCPIDGGDGECVSGRCEYTCLGTASLCGTACVETRSDPENCGGCGVVCGGVCSDGRCEPQIRSVVLGTRNGCVLDGEGKVYCWGSGSANALGLRYSGPIERPSPLSASADSAEPIVADAVSHDDTRLCYLADGDAYCIEVAPFSDPMGPQEVVSADASFAEQTLVDIRGKALTSCALDSDGGVWCWGDNSGGKLGVAPAESPDGAHRIDLRGPAASVRLVENAVCALLTDGTVQCWGTGPAGQLGAGASVSGTTTTPVDVVDTSGAAVGSVRELWSGRQEFCVVRGDERELLCWGENRRQLFSGDGALFSATAPDGEPRGVVAVGLVDAAACWWVGDDAHCRGRNDHNVLGERDAWAPAPIDAAAPRLRGIAGVVVSDSAFCGFRGEELVCWGDAGSGSVPWDGLVSERGEQVFDGDTAVSAVESYSLSRHGLCVVRGSRVRCWGDRRLRGARASDPLLWLETPSDFVRDRETMQPLNEVTQVEVGELQACALGRWVRGAGAYPYCWGDGFTDSEFALRVGDVPYVAMAVNDRLRCFVAEGGAAFCEDSTGPFSSSLLDSGVDQVAAGRQFFCFVREGRLYCAGTNSAAQLGRGPATAEPLRSITEADVILGPGSSPDGNPVVSVALGMFHGCAVNSANRVFCWGANHHSAVLPGAPSGFYGDPQQVDLPGETIDVAAGHAVSCAVNTAGEVHCWGDPSHGTTGNGAGSVRRIEVPPLADIQSGTRDGYAMCGRTRADQALYCWGFNPRNRWGTASSALRDPFVVTVSR